MARFSGLIGFSHTVRTRPGVSEEVVTEKGPYYGDVKRAALSQQQSESVNTDIRTTNLIEVIADGYVNDNVFAIRYVVWAGTPWVVTEATLERPRLQLRLGGVYSGSRPAEPAEVPDTP